MNVFRLIRDLASVGETCAQDWRHSSEDIRVCLRRRNEHGVVISTQYLPIANVQAFDHPALVVELDAGTKLQGHVQLLRDYYERVMTSGDDALSIFGDLTHRTRQLIGDPND